LAARGGKKGNGGKSRRKGQGAPRQVARAVGGKSRGVGGGGRIETRRYWGLRGGDGSKGGPPFGPRGGKHKDELCPVGACKIQFPRVRKNPSPFLIRRGVIIQLDYPKRGQGDFF